MTTPAHQTPFAGDLTYTQRKALRRLSRGQTISRSQVADPLLRQCFTTDHYPAPPTGDALNEVTWCDWETAVRNCRPQLTDLGRALLAELDTPTTERLTTPMTNKHLTIADPGIRLPGADNCITSVVALDSHKNHTRQCATCLRTFTGLAILVANEVNYRIHPEVTEQPGIYTYARCRNCCDAGRELPAHLVPADAGAAFADLGQNYLDSTDLGQESREVPAHV